MKKLCFSLLLFTSTIVYSQNLEIGATFGGGLYNGDLSPKGLSGYFGTIQPALGGFIRLNNGFVSFRLSYTSTTLTGDSEVRELNFETNLSEWAFTSELNLANWYARSSKTTYIPYVFGGLARYKFNPRSFFENRWIDLQPLGTEGQGLEGYEEKYQLSQWAIPMGLGMKMIIDEKWTIGIEFGGRKLFTDYLDDVSGTEVRYEDVLEGNGELAASLSRPDVDPDSGLNTEPYRRGNDSKDWYYIGTLSLSYSFGGDNNTGTNYKKIKCYQF